MKNSFFNLWQKLDFDEITNLIKSVTEDDVRDVLNKERLSIDDLHILYSEAAEAFLEEMALRSSNITRERFGNTIQLYAPLYLSNICTNSCSYCGFSAKNRDVVRRTLTLEEIEQELKVIAEMGIKHVLLLTGEAPNRVGTDYICAAVRLARKYASFVGIEVYPMSEEDYGKVIEAGVDGLTVYQETYDKKAYYEVHPHGNKRDIKWRLETPDRGGVSGMYSIGIGALLGLSEPRTDAYFSVLHAAYLTKYYWRSFITISFPRLRNAEGCLNKINNVADKTFVQFLLGARLILNDAGIVVSTREPAELRDHLVGLGVTQMSAASVTEPGGYTDNNLSTAQFEVEDKRSVSEFANMLTDKGFDPMMKNWDTLLSYKNV